MSKIRSYNYNNIFQRFIFDQNFHLITHFEKYAEKLVKNLDASSHLNYFIVYYICRIYTQYDNK